MLREYTGGAYKPKSDLGSGKAAQLLLLTNITYLGSAFIHLLHSASCTPLSPQYTFTSHYLGPPQRLCTLFPFVPFLFLHHVVPRPTYAALQIALPTPCSRDRRPNGIALSFARARRVAVQVPARPRSIRSSAYIPKWSASITSTVTELEWSTCKRFFAGRFCQPISLGGF